MNGRITRHQTGPGVDASHLPGTRRGGDIPVPAEPTPALAQALQTRDHRLRRPLHTNELRRFPGLQTRAAVLQTRLHPLGTRREMPARDSVVDAFADHMPIRRSAACAYEQAVLASGVPFRHKARPVRQTGPMHYATWRSGQVGSRTVFAEKTYVS